MKEIDTEQGYFLVLVEIPSWDIALLFFNSWRNCTSMPILVIQLN